MKNVSRTILFAGLLLAACTQLWTKAQLDAAVEKCTAEMVAPPTRASTETAKTYCGCYFQIVSSRYGHDQYASDPEMYDQILDKEGTTDSCIK